MNASYLVDTDWVIDHLNGQERTRRRLEALAASASAFPPFHWPRSARAFTTQTTPKGTSAGWLNSCKT
jgi:hypothetical protein